MPQVPSGRQIKSGRAIRGAWKTIQRLQRDVKVHTRFGLDVRRLVKNPITVEKARKVISYYGAERENHFLEIVEKAIFGYGGSPYRPLFDLAGCELGDVRALVRRSGLENTLRELRRSGVYVSYEEFKGRIPIVRAGKEFAVAPQDFHNPMQRMAFQFESGGTTGTPTGVPVSLGAIEVSACYEIVTWEAQGFHTYPWVLWRGVMPDAGIKNILRRAHWGSYPEHWYSPVVGSDQSKRLLKYRVATRFPLVMARSAGARIPSPEPLSLDQAGVIADWIATTIRAHGGAVVQSSPSSALRVCVSGTEKGHELNGAVFLVSGEPVTPGKAKQIAATGARLLSHYAFQELGRIGLGCADTADVTDVHLSDGLCAVIEHTRPVPDTEVTVPALNVTSVLPTAGMIMLNAEIDDFGVLESRSCGCALGDLGENTHLSQIRSYRKLAGEGATLLGSDILRVLDEVLPARFGGTALDYQLSEEEDEQGLTRFVIRISPRVNIDSESEVIEVVLASLGTDAQRGYTVPLWRQAGTFRIARIEPVWAKTGKLQPLDLERPGTS